jgi:hypothetical protein
MEVMDESSKKNKTLQVGIYIKSSSVQHKTYGPREGSSTHWKLQIMEPKVQLRKIALTGKLHI